MGILVDRDISGMMRWKKKDQARGQRNIRGAEVKAR